MSKKNDRVVVNTVAVSKMFEVTDRRVRQLVEEGVIDRIGHGRFDLVDTVSKYITHLRLSSGNLDSSDVTDSLEYEKYLHEKAKREKAEIELSHIKGDVHKSADIESVMNDMLASFRSKMLALPTKVAPSLIARDDISQVERMIEVQVQEALSELADYDPGLFRDEDEVEEDERREEYD